MMVLGKKNKEGRGGGVRGQFFYLVLRCPAAGWRKNRTTQDTLLTTVTFSPYYCCCSLRSADSFSLCKRSVVKQKTSKNSDNYTTCVVSKGVESPFLREIADDPNFNNLFSRSFRGENCC